MLLAVFVNSFVFSYLCSEKIILEFDNPIDYAVPGYIVLEDNGCAIRHFKQITPNTFSVNTKTYRFHSNIYVFLPEAYKKNNIKMYSKLHFCDAKLLRSSPFFTYCNMLSFPAKDGFRQAHGELAQKIAWFISFGLLVLLIVVIPLPAVKKFAPLLAKKSDAGFKSLRGKLNFLCPGVLIGGVSFALLAGLLSIYYFIFAASLKMTVEISDKVPSGIKVQGKSGVNVDLSCHKWYTQSYFRVKTQQSSSGSVRATLPTFCDGVRLKIQSAYPVEVESVTIGDTTLSSETLKSYSPSCGQRNQDIRLERITRYLQKDNPFFRHLGLCLLISFLVGMIFHVWHRVERWKNIKTNYALISSVALLGVVLSAIGYYLFQYAQIINSFPNDGDSAEIQGFAAYWLAGVKKYDLCITTDVTILGPLCFWAKHISSSWISVRIFSFLYMFLLMVIVYIVILRIRSYSWAQKIFLCSVIPLCHILVFGPPQKLFRILGEQYYCLFILLAVITLFLGRKNWRTIILCTFWAVAAIYCKKAAQLPLLIGFVFYYFFDVNTTNFFTKRNLYRSCCFIIPFLIAFIGWRFLFGYYQKYYLMTVNEYFAFLETDKAHLGAINGGMLFDVMTIEDVLKVASGVWNYYFRQPLFGILRLFFMLYLCFYAFVCKNRLDLKTRCGIALVLTHIPMTCIVFSCVSYQARWLAPGEFLSLVGCSLLLTNQKSHTILKCFSGLFLISFLWYGINGTMVQLERDRQFATEHPNVCSEMQTFVLKHAKEDVIWIQPSRFKASDFYWTMLRNIDHQKIVQMDKKIAAYNETSPVCLFPVQKAWLRDSIPPSFKYVWFDNIYFVVYSNHPQRK